MCTDLGHSEIAPTSIDLAVARLDDWLETTRAPSGYGGPVSHWWQQSLLYTGPGYDWRYEGIIEGYLTLWEQTHEQCWLGKAIRAGEDLVMAQLPDGHFPYSVFEMNPAIGGTPHEAAADLALLNLARSLNGNNQPDWEQYFLIASRNLTEYYLNKLWDEHVKAFRDHPEIPSFVPNKAATACEAFFAWSELTGDDQWVNAYALPNLDQILAHQIISPSILHGAIAQNSFGKKIIEKFMPFYIARCIPALVLGYEKTDGEKYLEAALNAMGFIMRQMQEDGSLPQALYPKSQINQHPGWVAGLGDVLRSADILRGYGFSDDLTRMEKRLLAGQDATGGIQTATGFSAQAGGKPHLLPDVRDLLHVVGWNDKAFRYLTGKVSGGPLPQAESSTFVAESVFMGRRMQFSENSEKVEITEKGKVVYLWMKGERWARQADPAFWIH